MQIKSVEYAKYGKQNNQHKYLLPEIMPESKYAMLQRWKQNHRQRIAHKLDDNDKPLCNCNSMLFYHAFYGHFPSLFRIFSRFSVTIMLSTSCAFLFLSVLRIVFILKSHFTLRNSLRIVNSWLQFSLKIQCHSFADLMQLFIAKTLLINAIENAYLKPVEQNMFTNIIKKLLSNKSEKALMGGAGKKNWTVQNNYLFTLLMVIVSKYNLIMFKGFHTNSNSC